MIMLRIRIITSLFTTVNLLPDEHVKIETTTKHVKRFIKRFPPGKNLFGKTNAARRTTTTIKPA